MKIDYMRCGCVTKADVMEVLNFCEHHEGMLCEEWEIEDTVER